MERGSVIHYLLYYPKGNPFPFKVRSLENQQLRGHRINVDKTVYQVVGLPIHVQGQMHRPRCLNELKEWAKVGQPDHM
jgi:hypothetical protein